MNSMLDISLVVLGKVLRVAVVLLVPVLFVISTFYLMGKSIAQLFGEGEGSI